MPEVRCGHEAHPWKEERKAYRLVVQTLPYPLRSQEEEEMSYTQSSGSLSEYKCRSCKVRLLVLLVKHSWWYFECPKCHTKYYHNVHYKWRLRKMR